MNAISSFDAVFAQHTVIVCTGDNYGCKNPFLLPSIHKGFSDTLEIVEM